MAATKEEILIEVEAVEAVYGEDCVVLDSSPPHLHLHIKPRTADVSSQQFVEAVIRIRAGSKYPEEPPNIHLLESKGLDEQREKHLITSIQKKAIELSSCLMLVALCEEAVEKLSAMNHPDGDCPLCLYPLVSVDEKKEMFPFMKLMSCFHCFHSECIIRWWNWLQKERESNSNVSSTTQRPVRDIRNQTDTHEVAEDSMGNCPVCRKFFHAKDLEHVLDLVGAYNSKVDSDSSKVVDSELLESDSENIRRQKFEATLKLQQENKGLIEPKKELLVLPGMYLPQPVTLPTQTSNEENTGQQQNNLSVPRESSSRPPGSSSSNFQQKNSGRTRHRVQNSAKPVRQWVRRENNTAS